MARLLKLTLCNIGSYAGVHELHLDLDGIVLVQGVNGSGKSTIFNSVCLGLFGTQPTDTLVGEIATWGSKKSDGCYSAVDFVAQDGRTYRSVYARDSRQFPSGHSILDQNGSVITDRAKDSRTKVESLLGTTYENYLSSFYMVQDGLGDLFKGDGDRLQAFLRLIGVDKQYERIDKLLKKRESDADLDCARSETRVHTLEESVKSFDYDSVVEGITRLELSSRINWYNHQELTTRLKYLTEMQSEFQTTSNLLSQIKRAIDSGDQEVLRNNAEISRLTMVIGTDRSTDITRMEMEISRIQGLINEYDFNQADQELRSLQKALSDGTSRFHTLEVQEIRCRRDLTRLTSEIASVVEVCPTCNQTIPLKTVQEIKRGLLVQVDVINSELQSVLQSRELLYPEQDANQKRSIVVETGIREYNEKVRQLNTLQSNLSRLTNGISDSKNKLDSLIIRNVELQRELPLKRQQHDELVEQLSAFSSQVFGNENPVTVLNRVRDQLSYATSQVRFNAQRIQDRVESLRVYEDSLESLETAKLAHENKVLEYGVIKRTREYFKALRWSHIRLVNDRLNAITHSYLQRLGFPYRVEFQVDEQNQKMPWLFTDSIGEKRRVTCLSVGQRRKVITATVFAAFRVLSGLSDCNVMFSDEPTGYLDAESRRLLFELLSDLKQSGKTIFVATHDEDIQSQGFDRILFVSKDAAGSRLRLE